MTSELKIIIGIMAATAGIFAGSMGNTLSDNIKDVQYTLQVIKVLKSDLSDGQSTCPSGRYVNELIVAAMFGT